VGRGASATTNRSQTPRQKKRLPSATLTSRKNKRPYIPTNLGGGSLVRLPIA
jgi:hypothetical protein